MRISDWSSDVCSSDLIQARVGVEYAQAAHQQYGHADEVRPMPEARGQSVPLEQWAGVLCFPGRSHASFSSMLGLSAIMRIQPLAISRAYDMQAYFHLRGHFLISLGEGVVRANAAADLFLQSKRRFDWFTTRTG